MPYFMHVTLMGALAALAIHSMVVLIYPPLESGRLQATQGQVLLGLLVGVVLLLSNSQELWPWLVPVAEAGAFRRMKVFASAEALWLGTSLAGMVAAMK